MTGSILIDGEVLKDFARRMLVAAGVGEQAAALTADSLVAANLRAVDSHGVQLLPYYIPHIQKGLMKTDTAGRVVTESGACLLYDGESGLGQEVAAICCDHAVRLGREHGLGAVTARNTNHFGAAAYWGQRISSAGMIGIVLCDASPIVAPWQGREGRLGTNPICLSVPGPDGRPFLLDMATTTVAMGKIYRAAFTEQPEIPAGWAMDSDGRPTTSTQAAMNRGMLMPLGGYKGSGLAMLVEILCGVLSGGAVSNEVGGLRYLDKPQKISQFFLAIDVSRFMPLQEFNARMDRLAALVKSAAPAAGYQEVLVAGDPEWRAEQTRRREGIPLDGGVWERLVKSAGGLGVEAPPAEPAA